MSDDLISRKFLLECTEYDNNGRLIIPYRYVKNAPTAFDKGKVQNLTFRKGIEIERLVIPNNAGSLCYNDTDQGLKLEPNEITSHQRRLLLERLHEYEDSGLTPEQIQELKERDTEKSVCHYHEEEKFRVYCPTCKRYLGIDFKEGYREPKNTFCPGCGQRVKWED